VIDIADVARPGGVYLDVLTPHQANADWAVTLLDSVFGLSQSYIPTDLVDTSGSGPNGGFTVRRLVVDDLAAMTEAASLAGTPIQVVSAYRSYVDQLETFHRWDIEVGCKEALARSARPGHSEHQLGTALDFTSEGGAAPWTYADWGMSATGRWMAVNAWRFGFVMSYPRGAHDLTGYDYEPWHFRYVGRQLAAAVHESRVPLRQYLWQGE